MLCFEMKYSSRSVGMSREPMELCELAEEQGIIIIIIIIIIINFINVS